MAKIWNSKIPGMNVTAQATGASAENIRLVNRNDAELAIVQSDTIPLNLVQNLITSCGGMLGVGIAMIGFCFTNMKWWERIWFAVAGLLLIDPGTLTDISGVVMLASGAFYQWWKKKAENEQVVTAVAPNLST